MLPRPIRFAIMYAAIFGAGVAASLYFKDPRYLVPRLDAVVFAGILTWSLERA